MQASDQKLMKAVRAGEEAALEALMRRHGNDLLGYLTRMLSVRAQAEDICQEAFIRVYTKASTFNVRRPFKPWLYAIATRLALDVLRRRGRHPEPASLNAAETSGVPLAERVPDSSIDSPAENAARTDTKALVLRALEGLPPRQRATLMLSYYEDLSYPEVARAMRCTVGTVKTQVSRALKTLARTLPALERSGVEGGVL